MSKTNRFPWYLIAWHCIWIIPVMAVRGLLCLLIGINNFSLSDMAEAWRVTE